MSGSSEQADVYIQPLPIWKSEQWYAMGFAQINTAAGPFWEVGMMFRTANYGRQVFDAIRAWNQNLPEDRANNISISFIVEADGDYMTYIYPGLPNVPSDAQIETAVLAKRFPNPPTSHFRRFQAVYTGQPFLFVAYVLEGGNPAHLSGVTPVWKFRLKIARRADLTPQELEYHHA